MNKAENMYIRKAKTASGKKTILPGTGQLKKVNRTGAEPVADNRQTSILQKKQLSAMNKQELTEGSIQKKTNPAGLPDALKSGIENLSGQSMDDVKVHYNAAKPAGINANAYAQGTDIHIAPGQEKHLPHEAWHVVQQKKGRVNPTKQLQGKININDDSSLEKEADAMGAKAMQQHKTTRPGMRKSFTGAANSIQGKFVQANIPGGNKVVQRNIEYDSKKKTYSGNSDRPGWLVVAEDALVDEYNLRFNLTLKKVEYAKLKMARCHIVSFDVIQTNLAKYLNGTWTANSMEEFINLVSEHLVPTGNEKKGLTTAWRYLQDEVATGNTSTIVSAANALLSRMNSISENLRAGDKYLNSYIQENFDPYFEKTDQSKYRLLPHGKSLLKSGVEHSGKLLRTPEHQQRIITSEGPIPFGSMTPDTRQITENHPFETRQVKSASVKKGLYGAPSLNPPVSNFQKKPIIDPKTAQLIIQIDFVKLQVSKLTKAQSEVNSIIQKHLQTDQYAAQYNSLQGELPKINNGLLHLQSSLVPLEQSLQNVSYWYNQNHAALPGLKLQLAGLQQTMQQLQSSDTNKYEQHEQVVNHQQSLYTQKSFLYNQQAHQQSFNQVSFLAQNSGVNNYLQARNAYYNMLQYIQDVNAKQNEYQQTYQQLQQQIAQVKNSIQQLQSNYSQAIKNLNQLELAKSVQDLKSMIKEYHDIGNNIKKAQQEIFDLQQQLK
jgi:Domain of unknown function (DUF4157)